MKWTTVEAQCNCPTNLRDWIAFVDRYDVDNKRKAEESIREAISEHMEESPHCERDNVTVTTYYKEEVEL